MKTNKQIKMELSKKLAPKIEELVNQSVADVAVHILQTNWELIETHLISILMAITELV